MQCRGLKSALLVREHKRPTFGQRDRPLIKKKKLLYKNYETNDSKMHDVMENHPLVRGPHLFHFCVKENMF